MSVGHLVAIRGRSWKCLISQEEIPKWDTFILPGDIVLPTFFIASSLRTLNKYSCSCVQCIENTWALSVRNVLFFFLDRRVWKFFFLETGCGSRLECQVGFDCAQLPRPPLIMKANKWLCHIVTSYVLLVLSSGNAPLPSVQRCAKQLVSN